MIRRLALTESASQTLELTEREAEILLALGRRLASKREWWGGEEPVERSVITCSRAPDGNWTVLVREAVGVILAGELQIVVHPKIDRNHFVYLAVQSDFFPRVEEIDISLGQSKDLWEVLVHWFLLAAERLLRRDLARGYAERVDELDAVRGRAVPIETALLVYQGRPAAVCEYEEFTEDIALNRVVRAAAERVASSPLIPFALRRRAKAILARLGDVGPLQALDLGVPLARLTQRYRQALVFAKPLLGMGGVELGHGDSAGWAFLIRTPELIEAGIRATIQRRLAPEWH